jgi:uracil-DNA glycosylase
MGSAGAVEAGGSLDLAGTRGQVGEKAAMLQTAPEVAEQRFPDNLPPGWRERLAPEVHKPYFRELIAFLNQEYRSGAQVYPARQNVLRALQSLDYADVRVVILGQDPYHGAGQALGLSFAVPNELVPKPPSLLNIFKEISTDLNVDMSQAGSDLSGWVQQGVLLLNTVLTVRAGQPLSHRGMGWETLTDQIIGELDRREQPVLFLLWGSAAQKKKLLLTRGKHYVLECAHPSPLSAARGFLGCKHFSRANAILTRKLGLPAVDWTRTVAE